MSVGPEQTDLVTAQAVVAELEKARDEALAWVEHWKKYQREQKRRKRAVSALYGKSLKRIAELTAALPDPGKLWSLAIWLDEKYPNGPLPVVQDDLRAWARAIYALDPERYGKSGVHQIEVAATQGAQAGSEGDHHV